MRASPIVMCCWPGLPRLWLCGDWFSLLVALAFGGVLNLLLVSACVRPAWLPWPANGLAWLSVGGFWFVSAVRAHRNCPELCQTLRVADDRGLFLKAQGEYLQSHWFEAESVLNQLLRQSRRDIEARLMLATVYRHTRRYDEAIAELGVIEQFDGAEKWHSEIAAERRLVQRGLATQEPLETQEPRATSKAPVLENK